MSNITLIDNYYDKTLLFLDKIIHKNDKNYTIYLNFVSEIKNYYMKNDIEEYIKNLNIQNINNKHINIYLNNIKLKMKNIIFGEINENIINRNISFLFYFFLVGVVSKLNISIDIFNYDKTNLLLNYPEYKDLDDNEINSLITFRNILRCAFMIMSPKKSKDKLFNIIPFLIGENKKYIIGGGQKEETRRRVEIYNFEGNIIPLKRKKRCIEENIIPLKRKKRCIEENIIPLKRKKIKTDCSNNFFKKIINYDYLDNFDLTNFYSDNFYLNNMNLDHIKLDDINLDILNNLDLNKIYLDFTSIKN